MSSNADNLPLQAVVDNVELFSRNGIRVNGHLPYKDDLMKYLCSLTPAERLYVRAEMNRRMLQVQRVLSVLDSMEDVDKSMSSGNGVR